ncbi:MAG: lipopolysaccharide biosynthesis protein [Marinifilaceae bacterium]
MNPLKKLAGETAIYGVSTILGRLLNWLLVPLYTRIFLAGEYGVVTNLMSYVAFLLVVLTYGMETGFFRFASDEKYGERVYPTGMFALTLTTALFWFVLFGFSGNISTFLEIPDHPEYIYLLALTVGMDALTALPFAKLRQQKRPARFAFIKLANIGVNIGLNLFFLLLCPWIVKNFSSFPLHYIYNPEIGIGYIFIAYFIASLTNVLLLVPEIFKFERTIDFSLLKRMLSYSFPILMVSIAGMININADKMLMPKLIPADQNPMFQTGIYGANYKLGVIMTLFIQAFRFAFEPFFFSQAKNENSHRVYADVLKYFVVFGMLIFLGVMFYLDLVKLLIDKSYHEGLVVVPFVLMANLFLGIFFSLSLWYKLSDNTKYGAYIAIGGSALTLVLNVLLVPFIGYMGAAIAAFACFFLMTVVSYVLGQKKYPIPYDLKSILVYFGFGLLLFFFGKLIQTDNQWIDMLLRTPLLVLFVGFVIVQEKLWPSLKRFIGR